MCKVICTNTWGGVVSKSGIHLQPVGQERTTPNDITSTRWHICDDLMFVQWEDVETLCPSLFMSVVNAKSVTESWEWKPVMGKNGLLTDIYWVIGITFIQKNILSLKRNRIAPNMFEHKCFIGNISFIKCSNSLSLSQIQSHHKAQTNIVTSPPSPPDKTDISKWSTAFHYCWIKCIISSAHFYFSTWTTGFPMNRNVALLYWRLQLGKKADSCQSYIP